MVSGSGRVNLLFVGTLLAAGGTRRRRSGGTCEGRWRSEPVPNGYGMDGPSQKAAVPKGS